MNSNNENTITKNGSFSLSAVDESGIKTVTFELKNITEGTNLPILTASDNSGIYSAYFNAAQYSEDTSLELTASVTDKKDNASVFGPYRLKINITATPSVPVINELKSINSETSEIRNLTSEYLLFF